tara:strand:+ start:2243 stop:2368 length:126 start_codon:yes stop_codon:yes gene_type:complete
LTTSFKNQKQAKDIDQDRVSEAIEEICIDVLRDFLERVKHE